MKYKLKIIFIVYTSLLWRKVWEKNSVLYIVFFLKKQNRKYLALLIDNGSAHPQNTLDRRGRQKKVPRFFVIFEFLFRLEKAKTLSLKCFYALLLFIMRGTLPDRSSFPQWFRVSSHNSAKSNLPPTKYSPLFFTLGKMVSLSAPLFVIWRIFLRIYVIDILVNSFHFNLIVTKHVVFFNH